MKILNHRTSQTCRTVMPLLIMTFVPNVLYAAETNHTALATQTIEHQIPSPFGRNREESRCGLAFDWQEVEQYDGTLGVTTDFVDTHERPVGNIVWTTSVNSTNLRGQPWCTGTLISENLFLTAGHCFDREGAVAVGWDWPRDRNGNLISPQAAAPLMRVDFDFQVDSNGNTRPVDSYNVTVLEEFELGGLDYAIIGLEGQPGTTHGFAYLDDSIPNPDDILTIIQHPAGMTKKVHTGNYDGIEAFGALAGYMRYTDLDTEGGASGSGVLDLLGRIIGVHTNAGCTDTGGANHGVLIDDIANHSPTIASLVSGTKDPIWWSNGDRTFTGDWTSVRGTYKPIRGDFDGDGVADIFWYRAGGLTDYIWWGKRNRTFTSTSTNVDGAYTPFSGDFDNDGNTDIFWYRAGSGSDYIWWGNRNRTFTRTTTQVNGTYVPISGDFDKDGNSDIFWYRAGSGKDYIWWSNGNRTFASTANDVNGTYLPIGGDFDHDGHADIFWYRAGARTDYIWWGNGSRTFTSTSTNVYDTYTPLGGDFDNDGSTDILWYRPGSGNDYIWWGRGNRSFRRTSTTVNGSYRPIVGDFDGDGDDDVFWYREG